MTSSILFSVYEPCTDVVRPLAWMLPSKSLPLACESKVPVPTWPLFSNGDSSVKVIALALEHKQLEVTLSSLVCAVADAQCL